MNKPVHQPLPQPECQNGFSAHSKQVSAVDPFDPVEILPFIVIGGTEFVQERSSRVEAIAQIYFLLAEEFDDVLDTGQHLEDIVLPALSRLVYPRVFDHQSSAGLRVLDKKAGGPSSADRARALAE